MEMTELLALTGGIAVIVFLWIVGAPMFAAFVGGSVVLFVYYANVPITAVPQIAFGAMDKYLLTAIPVFILVGELMQVGGAGDAYFRLIRATVGHLRAGLAITAIVACMFFGAITGSCIATAVAIGSIVSPHMLKSGYRREVIAGVCGTAGTLGILIPPSISMILVGDVTGVPVGKMFIGGIIPGIMLTLLLCIAAYFICSKMPEIKLEQRVSFAEWWAAFVYALPALTLPVIILGSIYGGIATPTEAAVIAAAASVLAGIAYRRLTWPGLLSALKISARSTSTIYCIIFGALLFGRVLAFMEVPQTITRTVTTSGLGRTEFLLAFIILFFIFGMFFDGIVMTYVALPVAIPALLFYKIDMLPFGILFVLLVMVGQVTPPVGITLWAATTTVKAEAAKTVAVMWPLLLALVAATLIVAFFPEVASFLPNQMVRAR